jgi:hypothetical protein
MIPVIADSARISPAAIVGIGKIIKHVTTSDATQNDVHQ